MISGLLLLAAELAALAAVGYVVVRLALRQTDDRVVLAQGQVDGLALWGVIVNFVMYAVPGLAVAWCSHSARFWSGARPPHSAAAARGGGIRRGGHGAVAARRRRLSLHLGRRRSPHSPDPDRAASGGPARWLRDPSLFEALVVDGGETVSRVPPAFLELNVPLAPHPYEAVRRAVPASSTVYVPSQLESLELMRAAWALSHARLFGVAHTPALHSLTPWPAAPLGDQVPDLIVLALSVKPWMFPPEGRQPICWYGDEDVAVIPLLQIEISETAAVAGFVYDGEEAPRWSQPSSHTARCSIAVRREPVTADGR